MFPSKRALLSGFAMFCAGALCAAADLPAPKVVSSPGAFWTFWGAGKVNYVAATGLKGGAAQRVTIAPKPSNLWDVGIVAEINKPVKKGDVLVLTFWARAEKPPAGSDLIMISGRIYEVAAADVAIAPDSTFIMGKQWKLYYAAGTVAKDYPAGALKAGMLLGTGEQVIDFGPVTVVDYGPGFDPGSLPRE